ncbi:restriction endonuclease subunit S [Paenibacillus sp. FSL E2-0177]|uniref:restriction endonuclease subunit S n=1 Tax=Paenibacillus sp. FSL E2-0177 TaxID=2921360 RepID=UPI0030ECEAF7
MMKQTNLVPKRRFREFQDNDAWEQREFFDNIKSTVDFRGRTPKKLGLDWSETGYLALSALNVKHGYIDPSADAHYGNQELYDKWMTGRELRKGQVLFTTEAPMGNVAQVPDDKGYILSQRTIAFDVNPEKITNDFLAVLLRSPKTFAELSALSSGGTAKGVSQKSLSQLKVTLPKDLEEQAKVAALFKKLDHLITLQQRKLDKLKALKSAYLSEMFPADGESEPKRRFAGFTQAWEQRKLGELCDEFQSGKYIKTEDIRGEGRYPVFGGNGLRGYTNTYNHDGLFALIGRQGALCGNMNISLGKAYFTEHAIAVKGNKNNETRFLFYLLGEMNLGQYSGQSAQPGLAVNKLIELSVFIPSFTEQARIGAFFKQLDKLITLHQRKLEKLQNIKKAYLNEMFV